jgi:hypothetical protein
MIVPFSSVSLIPSFELSHMKESTFVAFCNPFSEDFCFFADSIGLAVMAAAGLKGMMLPLIAADSIISSWRLSSHSYILSLYIGTRLVPSGLLSISERNSSSYVLNPCRFYKEIEDKKWV